MQSGTSSPSCPPSPAEAAEDPFEALPPTAVVAVAMSGGVDSSVVAARIAASGHRAFGITLAMWPNSREAVRDRGCCSIDAVEDARRVARQLGLDHYVWNLEAEFEDAVIREFEDGYASGLTPNPCISCNQRVKFGLLLQRALAAGASHLATGHYARLRRGAGGVTLHRAADLRRDQSYVLHRLSQRQLSHTVLPLGSAGSKQSVRDEAARLGLLTAGKPESQDLCFLEGGLRSELSRRLAGRFAPGPVVDLSGAVVGSHDGLPFLTVGQRSGLRLLPTSPHTTPSYVLALRPADNAVVVGPRSALSVSSVVVTGCSWISGRPPEPGGSCEAQIRAHGEPTAASVVAIGGEEMEVRFATPLLQSCAPGQSLVLYRGDQVLGGGSIVTAEAA